MSNSQLRHRVVSDGHGIVLVEQFPKVQILPHAVIWKQIQKGQHGHASLTIRLYFHSGWYRSISLAFKYRIHKRFALYSLSHARGPNPGTYPLELPASQTGTHHALLVPRKVTFVLEELGLTY